MRTHQGFFFFTFFYAIIVLVSNKSKKGRDYMGSSGENCTDKIKMTPCEIKVIEAYIKGKNQSDAFCEGYKRALKWKRKTVNEKASKFFSQDKIKARVKQLQEKSNTKAVLTRQELLEGLTTAFKMALGLEWQEIEEMLLNGNDEVLSHSKKKLKSADLKNIKGIADTLAKLQGWEKQQELNATIPKIEIVGAGRYEDKD